MIYCCLDIFSQPVTIQFSLILLATRVLLGPFNNKRTIWENTERSRDAEIFKKKYQSCNKYIYISLEKKYIVFHENWFKISNNKGKTTCKTLVLSC